MSLEASSICVVDGAGKSVREAKVASEPEALIVFFRSLGFEAARIGLEAGPSRNGFMLLSKKRVFRWSFWRRGMCDAFKAMAVKTDRKDARGIAQLLRLGWFKPVPCKSAAAQEVRALLTARKLVQSKLYDIEMSLRGILRGFSLKIGPTTPKRLEPAFDPIKSG